MRFRRLLVCAGLTVASALFSGQSFALGVGINSNYNYYNYSFAFYANQNAYPNTDYLFLTLTTNSPETTNSPGATVTSIFGSGSLPSLGLPGFHITGPAPEVSASNSVFATPDYFSSISFYVSTSVPPGPSGSPLSYSYPPAGNYSIFTLVDPNGVFNLTDSFDCSNGTCNPGTLTANGPLTLTGMETPLPASLPLFASALGALVLFGWRQKRKAAAFAV